MNSKDPPHNGSDHQAIPQDRLAVYDDPEAVAAEQRGSVIRDERSVVDFESPSGREPGREPDEEQSIRSYNETPSEEEHNTALLARDHADALRAQ
jgi:hypothetical protein